MDFPQQIEGMLLTHCGNCKISGWGGCLGTFGDWWVRGFIRTPLLHSDVMRLRRSVQLVLILITCKKTKIHKMIIQKNKKLILF